MWVWTASGTSPQKGRIVKADASALGKSAVGVGDISALYRCRQLLIIRDVVGDIFKYGGNLFSITVTACAKLRSLFNAVIRLAEADVLGGQKIWAEIGNLCRKAFVKGNGIGLARYISSTFTLYSPLPDCSGYTALPESP